MRPTRHHQATDHADLGPRPADDDNTEDMRRASVPAEAPANQPRNTQLKEKFMTTVTPPTDESPHASRVIATSGWPWSRGRQTRGDVDQALRRLLRRLLAVVRRRMADACRGLDLVEPQAAGPRSAQGRGPAVGQEPRGRSGIGRPVDGGSTTATRTPSSTTASISGIGKRSSSSRQPIAATESVVDADRVPLGSRSTPCTPKNRQKPIR